MSAAAVICRRACSESVLGARLEVEFGSPGGVQLSSPATQNPPTPTRLREHACRPQVDSFEPISQDIRAIKAFCQHALDLRRTAAAHLQDSIGWTPRGTFGSHIGTSLVQSGTASRGVFHFSRQGNNLPESDPKSESRDRPRRCW